MNRIQAGITRKLGLPRYSSAQASLMVDAEFDGSLLHDQARLAQVIKDLYRVCEEAVGEELARLEEEARRAEEPLERSASPAQLRVIRSLARRRRLDLALLLDERFGLTDETLLTTRQASAVIDELSSRVLESPREHPGNARHPVVAHASEV